jgi:DNA/RNA-binding domain of Phe-tRNA-synthetase-like protein
MSAAPDVRAGWVAAKVAEELPGLRLAEADAVAATGHTPRALRARLGALADRFGGARALELRREAVPAAYRVVFRHAGLDPDVDRPPAEAAVLDRLVHGGFRPRGMPHDALLLAVVETGVPVWAVDAARVDGPLGIRGATPGERLGEGAHAVDLPAGRLVVADAAGPLGVLFADVDPRRAPTRATTTLRLFAVAVAGVPDVHVEEALQTAADALAAAAPPTPRSRGRGQ